MSDKTTYESLDNRIAPEALTKDHTKGLAVIDGHAVKSQEDYEDPDRLYDILIARIRKYHPSTDVSLIEKAYKLAVEAHGDQRRKSGEPYIIHPLWVAIILADLEMDKETIAAGMLHDVVEDTKFTEEDIRKEFGAEVALLVDGVTKLGRLSYSSDKLEVQAENLRKMFLAMAKDIRVIIIKLADRLHNMRTLQFMTPAKQKEKAKETMDIYAPIAHRLGISKIKTELDDLSLKYLQPEVYKDLEEKLQTNKEGRENFIQSIIDEQGYNITPVGCGSMFQIYFNPAPVYNNDDAHNSDAKRFLRYFRALLKEGVFIPPSQFECNFISSAHSMEDLTQTAEAIEVALEVAFKKKE